MTTRAKVHEVKVVMRWSLLSLVSLYCVTAVIAPSVARAQAYAGRNAAAWLETALNPSVSKHDYATAFKALGVIAEETPSRELVLLLEPHLSHQSLAMRRNIGMVLGKIGSLAGPTLARHARAERGDPWDSATCPATRPLLKGWDTAQHGIPLVGELVRSASADERAWGVRLAGAILVRWVGRHSTYETVHAGPLGSSPMGVGAWKTQAPSADAVTLLTHALDGLSDPTPSVQRAAFNALRDEEPRRSGLQPRNEILYATHPEIGRRVISAVAAWHERTGEGLDFLASVEEAMRRQVLEEKAVAAERELKRTAEDLQVKGALPLSR